jgi:putative DNA primase/helicase
MRANEIIHGLGGNPDTGMCCCPAHDDKTPSLKVSEGPGGKPLVKCYAGCSQDKLIDALKGRGLWHKNLSQPRVARKAWPAPTEDAEWPPRNPAKGAHDKLREAYRILREAMGANMRERRRPDAQEELAAYFNARGIDRVPPNALYLPKNASRRLTGKPFPAMALPILGNEGLQGVQLTFLTADGTRNLRGNDKKSIRRFYGASGGGHIPLGEPDPNQPLIIAEGVESALSASQIAGLPAMAALSANNMKAIAPPPCSEIIIAADNDESGTGKKAAEELARRLNTSGRVVRIQMPERPEGVNHYDFNNLLRDALKDGTDIAQLRDEILCVEPFEGEYEVTALGMEPFMELQFPPRQFLLKPWLTTTGLVMIDAQPGHGKTWLALSVGYAVAAGAPLLDWASEHRGRVLYVDGELPGELLQKRLRTLGPPLPEGDLLVLSRAQFEMFGELMPDLGTSEGRAFLDKIIDDNKIELVILDSVSTLVRSGMDNDVESWRAIQDWSLKHRARGRAVIYLHHHGRSGNPRGTSAREIVLDSRIKLVREEEASTETETAFKLEFAKAREFYGADTAAMLAYLSTKSGVVEWRRESVKDNTRARVKELKEQGMKPSDIAKELGITKGRVSQVMKELYVKKDNRAGSLGFSPLRAAKL